MPSALLLLPVLAASFQALPAAPHPSRPVPSPYETGLGDYSGWTALRPGWLESRQAELIPESGRRALGVFLGSRLEWDPGTVERWLTATRPDPLPVRYRLVSAGGRVALAGTEAAWPGRPVVFSDLARQNVVYDYRVQIAMSAAIAHPQRGEQVAGTSLALRLLPVPGAGWQAEVALVVSRPAPAEAVDLGYHAIAGKDRLRQGFEECGFTTLLLPRKPAELELPGAAGGWRLELRVDAEPPPLQLGAGDAVVMAVPTLAARSDWPAFVASLEGSGSLWSSRGGFLAFLDRNGPDQAVLVAEEAQRRATARAIRLRVTSEGEDGPVLAALDLPVVDGQPVRFASGEIFQALTGWTVEVAQDARVAEPAFEWFHDGVQGAIVPEPDPDGGLLLRLEFVLRRVRLGDADVLVLAGETAGIAMDRRVVTEPPVKVRVERPVASEVAVRGTYRPDPEGRVVIEREAPRSSGEPVRLRIELAVSSAP